MSSSHTVTKIFNIDRDSSLSTTRIHSNIYNFYSLNMSSSTMRRYVEKNNSVEGVLPSNSQRPNSKERSGILLMLPKRASLELLMHDKAHAI